MNTINQQIIYEKDTLICKQAKQIKKLQLEVNALKILLSGPSLNKSEDSIATPLPRNNDHKNTFWQSQKLIQSSKLA